MRTTLKRVGTIAICLASAFGSIGYAAQEDTEKQTANKKQIPFFISHSLNLTLNYNKSTTFTAVMVFSFHRLIETS